MLIRFNVGNYLSFREVQEFSMIAGKVRNKTEHIYADRSLKLLKFASIFGANASGKSNFVKAMEFAREVILYGTKRRCNNCYFKLDESFENKPSYFEFEVMVNNKYYSYGFEILLKENVFTSEWLIELLTNGEEKVLFKRDITKNTFESSLSVNNKNLRKKFEVYSDDIKANKSTLFLYEMNRNKNELYKSKNDLLIFNEVFTWFETTLDINHPYNTITDFSYFIETEKSQVSEIIKAFGTGITEFNIIDLSIDEIRDKIPSQILEDVENKINDILLDSKNEEKAIKGTITLKSPDAFFIINFEKGTEIQVTTIEFEHEKKGKTFNVSEESDGTKRILELIQILLSKEGSVYIVDEIDRSLHPQLTYKFIEAFLKIAEKKSVQLVITTHESRLLDFGLLRQDEVWLMNKNKDGESQLYSLDEYNVRFDQKIDKAYLEGRYGGVPIFSTIFPIKED